MFKPEDFLFLGDGKPFSAKLAALGIIFFEWRRGGEKKRKLFLRSRWNGEGREGKGKVKKAKNKLKAF
jgi:hypothetical protein